MLKDTTDDELLEQLRLLSKRLGRRPRSKDCTNSNGMFHISSYKKRFGTWSKALELAGMPIPKFDRMKWVEDNKDNIREKQWLDFKCTI